MNDRSIHERLSSLLCEGNLEVEWDVSEKTMPGDGLFFLAHDAVAESCELVGLEKEAAPYLQSAADRIAADPALARLAWHCHHLLTHSESYPRGDSRTWPSLEDFLGDQSGAFYLLIAFSGLPKARAFHQSRGIPERIARDTYSDTAIWARDYKDMQGVWGMRLHILPWLFNHLRGELFRLVRLQFIQRPFRAKLRAFRNRATREVIVLADEGVTYRGDGELDGTGGVHDPDTAWTSRLLMDQKQVTGTPIHPTGIALSEEISLPLDVWEPILKPGDPIVEIHIPAGSPMDFDACGDSFRLAVDFFPRYFPDRPFKAFCCGSWILNTQFQDMLPAGSNLVRFQKEFYLFPIRSDGRSGLGRIFRRDIQDFSTAPRDTKLRRAVLDHLQAGGYLRAGGALLFAEDLDWENQIYRKMWNRRENGKKTTG